MNLSCAVVAATDWFRVRLYMGLYYRIYLFPPPRTWWLIVWYFTVVINKVISLWPAGWLSIPVIIFRNFRKFSERFLIWKHFNDAILIQSVVSSVTLLGFLSSFTETLQKFPLKCGFPLLLKENNTTPHKHTLDKPGSCTRGLQTSKDFYNFFFFYLASTNILSFLQNHFWRKR